MVTQVHENTVVRQLQIMFQIVLQSLQDWDVCSLVVRIGGARTLPARWKKISMEYKVISQTRTHPSWLLILAQYQDRREDGAPGQHILKRRKEHNSSPLSITVAAVNHGSCQPRRVRLVMPITGIPPISLTSQQSLQGWHKHHGTGQK
jgi:hypothetical protein